MRNYGTTENIELRGPALAVRIERLDECGFFHAQPCAIYCFSPRRQEWEYKGLRYFPRRISYIKLYSELVSEWTYEGRYIEADDDADHGAPWYYR